LKKERVFTLCGSLFAVLLVGLLVPPPSLPQPRTSVLHLYSLNAFTGPSAPYGLRGAHGAAVAAKQINDAGGFADSKGNKYTIKLTDFDVDDSKDQGIAGLRRAADDSTVLVVIGPSPSTVFLGLLPAVGQLKMPIVSFSLSPVKLEMWNRYAFRAGPTHVGGTPKLIEVVTKQLKFTRIAFLSDITNDFQQAEAVQWRRPELQRQYGYTIVADESFRANDMDYRPQLTKIQQAKPQALEVNATLQEAVKIANQMAEMGLLGKVQLLGAAFNDSKAWELTEGKILGAIGWQGAGTLGGSDPEIQRFIADYAKQYPNESPTSFSTVGYQSMMAIVDAVKRAGTVTDREKFRDALAKTSISTLGGKIAWDNLRDKPMGDNLSPTIQVFRVTGSGTVEDITPK
jgi:branched-chain amino acid transport system substrate-binding protein